MIFIQIGQDLSRLRQYGLPVPQDRDIILAGYLEDLLPRRTKIRDDHSLIGETQIFQLFPHHGALRAPFDMIQR
jgi:hypothetical protein